MKSTKIVCTLGPASADTDTLTAMIEAGMDVARLNFSHGSYDDLTTVMDALDVARDKTGKDVPIMMDTQGPEIRTGHAEEELLFHEGDSVTLVGDADRARQSRSTESRLFVTYDDFATAVEPGMEVLLDDGRITGDIRHVADDEVRMTVTSGGSLGSRKGVNVPEAAMGLPVLTEKDKEDLRFAQERGIDFVALSFVRTDQNLVDAREHVEDDVRIISKIEDRRGTRNIDDIIRLSDGVMVARGDLGVELSLSRVPGVQRSIIRKSVKRRKPVVTATEMLDSMEESSRPTRAEVSDVHQAVREGSSAVMLSGETAVGEYPVEAVRTMACIIRRAEKECDFSELQEHVHVRNSVTTSICDAAVESSKTVNAAAIVAYTESGRTARSVGAFRPDVPTVAATPNPGTRRQCHLYWGVVPTETSDALSIESLFTSAEYHACDVGVAEEGDTIVTVAGTPVGERGSTNTIRIATVGDVVVRGYAVQDGTGSGAIRFCRSADAVENVPPGAIPVLFRTRLDWVERLDEPAAVLIAYKNADESQFAHLDCPVISEVLSVAERLSEDDRVRVLGDKGVVMKM